ncbi:MAG: polysaccharide biosynthesis protein, partial [Dehalococcoidia bacterium]
MSDTMQPAQSRNRLNRALVAMPRRAKRGIMLAADAIMIPASLWVAFALKYDSLAAGASLHPALYIGATIASMAIFGWAGLYRAVVRFISFRVLLAILGGTIASAVALGIESLVLSPQPLPLSLIAIYGLNVMAWVSASRIVARWVLSGRGSAREPVVIYGAGDAGAQLAVALAAGSAMLPVAYIDEKSALQRALIAGIPVRAPGDLPDLVREHGVRTVLLAIPSASRQRRAAVIRKLEGLGVRIQTVPNLDDITSGRASVSDLRQIDVADLLGRDPVPPNSALLGACIRGKSVMVTGAGGSIGSELCRQIVRLAPRRLVLFEMSEYALYNIERELQAVAEAEGLQVEILALLGNAHHKQRVREILRAFAVETVYHAAAYKHVPIVEHNIIEGMHNNIVSTWYTAEAALETGVQTFVLISTDKAVNPTNVMGATKRFAEIVLQALQQTTRRTRFCMVRFGNVLASSGSVVPLFQEQIRAGGPVTVTHPEVMRYFMTIPEAAALVLQAGSMGEGGDVFVLDMGKPVRISDLARRMVALAGYSVRDDDNPNGDIEIRFTGLRPAEKLFEELLIGNNVMGTEHPMIMRALEHTPTWEQLQPMLRDLLAALNRCDCRRALDLLAAAVREYRPSEQAHDLVWAAAQRRAEAQREGAPGVVVRLP